ncbi:hypothetical protein GCM10009544_55510 [Streptomyces stramineus]|uniref:Ricin B lectin domain-containing protein n=2 Tax=Streptomyces TaxID=1883 RepID=A0ABP3KWK3_9ACTN
MALSFPATAHAAPVSDYRPGNYSLQITDAYIVDPQGTVDPNDRCVELFGSFTINQGGQSNNTYFRAPRRRPVDACEPLVGLSQGKQVADLPMNGDWGKVGHRLNFRGDTADKGWTLTADLNDADGPGTLQRLCKDSITLKPAGDHWVYVWDCHGADGAQVNVHFRIRRHDPEQARVARKLLDVLIPRL